MKYIIALVLMFVTSMGFASQSEYYNYTIAPGDTLGSIASNHLRLPNSTQPLLQYNGISANQLTPGRVIRIPYTLSNVRMITVANRGGSVQLNDRTLNSTQVARPADRVTTGQNSRALITFDDGSTIMLNPNSNMTISAIQMEGRNRISTATLSAGSAQMNITRLNRESSFSINTVSAVCGVRGTSFSVEIYDDSMHISVWSGQVTVTGVLTGEVTVIRENHILVLSSVSGEVIQLIQIPGYIQWLD